MLFRSELEAFDEERLAESVRRAAGASEDAVMIADAVAGAVFHYARDHAADRTVTVGEIAEMVEALLLMLGFDEASQQYGGEIRLDELAARNTVGFELAFYGELRQALTSALPRQAVRLSGLRACVLRLRGTQRWGVSCRRLAEEILGFVYAQAARARTMNLAVVE